MSLDTYSIRFGIKTARRGQHRSDERLVGIPTWPVRVWAKEYRAFHFISSASTHLAGKCLYFSSYELRYNLHVYQSSTKEGHQGPTFLADMDTHPIQVRAFSCSSLLPSLMTDEDADIDNHFPGACGMHVVITTMPFVWCSGYNHPGMTSV